MIGVPVTRGKVCAAALAVALGARLCACGAPARNIILFIGDGMGLEQVRAARCYAGASLSLEAFPFKSQVATIDASGGITDSAAAATAISTGRKVYSGVVSLAFPGGGEELETLLEFYGKRGKSAGLVTTSYLTDATPAAFGAHAWNRYANADVAADYLWQTRPAVLLGGGGAGLSAEAAAAAG
jgi:alkaline phosphatase